MYKKEELPGLEYKQYKEEDTKFLKSEMLKNEYLKREHFSPFRMTVKVQSE